MTRTAVSKLIVAVALVANSACNDSVDTGIDELDMFPDAGTEAQSDGGVTYRDKPTFAVALSDYESAGVAIVDGEGKVLRAKYISSGSEVPGLSSALHGDIALPTQPCTPGQLTVVARAGGDYILQVDLKEGKVSHQIATQGSTGAAAYSSNPQDILCLEDGEALVTRFEPNIDPSADPLDRGDDILRIDLDSQKRLSRIDLSKLRGTAEGYNADGKPEQQTAYVRPGSIVRLRNHAAVAIARLTESYSAAEGMLAIVDLKTEKVTSLDLPKVRNCAALVPVSGRSDQVILSCAGSPYGDRATAGLVLVSVATDGKAKVEYTYQASEKLPVIYAAPVSIGGTRAVAVATGDFDAMTPDTAFVVDFANGEASELFSAGSAGDLGVGAGGAYMPESRTLALPDASTGIRYFEVGTQEVKAKEVSMFDPLLPVRGIRPLVAF